MRTISVYGKDIQLNNLYFLLLTQQTLIQGLNTNLANCSPELSKFYRDSFYDLLNESGDFTSETLSKTDNENINGFYLNIYGKPFQFVCIFTKKSVSNEGVVTASNCYLRVYGSGGKFSLYNILSLDKTLEFVNSDGTSYAYANNTAPTTLVYRGSKNGSFLVNITIDGSKKQNMAFMTIHKFVDSEVIGFRSITATAGTYHNVLATASIFAYDVVSTATTISATTMASYVNTVDTMQKRSQFFHNILMHQMYGSYKDNSVIVGNQKYYRQYNFYEVEGNAYYCVTNGVLLLVDKIK